jgi:hypothetical protein
VSRRASYRDPVNLGDGMEFIKRVRAERALIQQKPVPADEPVAEPRKEE